MPGELVTISDLEALERRLSRPGLEQDVNRLKGWKRGIESDESFGRIFSGPQWLGGASIVDGTVEGNVFKANVTISNLFTTAESPADRWELDPTGFRAYGTVLGTPNTKTLHIHEDGDFEFGVGASQITFVASTGTLTVPAAVIGSLTIADVGSGVMGGNYDTSLSNPRVRLNTAGLVATNSGGTTTFNLQSSTGDFFMTGNFTIASSTSAANRIELHEGGIELWKSSVREFYLQAGGATNGISMLLTGPSVGQYIGMQPDTGLWLGASAFGSAPFRVTNAGAVTMTSATITNGTLTSPSITSASITSTTITGQTIRTGSSNPKVEMTASGVFVYNSGGTNTAAFNNDGSGFAGTGGNFSWNTSGTLTVNGSALSNGSVSDSKIATLTASKITTGTLTSTIITIGSGGSIVDADGSEWSQSGIILKSAGSFGDTIKWQVSGVDKGSLFADSTKFYMQYSSGGLLQLESSKAMISNASGADRYEVASGTALYAYKASVARMAIEGTHTSFELTDTAGASRFIIQDSAGVEVFSFNSDGELVRPIANDATAEGSYFGRIPIYINGSLKYISIHNA